MNPQFLQKKFSDGLAYEAYLQIDVDKAQRWREFAQHVALSPAQHTLVAGFTRRMNILVISGIWCGDCVQQGPLIQAIGDAGSTIAVRWLERDAHLDLAGQVQINAGLRVPVVIFMAEDFEPVSIMGDRTLARYRALAAKQLGASCPLPGAPVPQDEINATTQDWVDEFERVHLLLRLSGRLRQKHCD